MAAIRELGSQRSLFPLVLHAFLHRIKAGVVSNTGSKKHLQLVASRRGVAALPNWGVKNYVEHDYVIAKRIGAKGLWSDLYAVASKINARKTYMQDFIGIVREKCAADLDGIRLL